jgi:adenosylhomocysteine nucleosidase
LPQQKTFLFFILLSVFLFGFPDSGYLFSSEHVDIVVLISADAEWNPVREYFARVKTGSTPFGEFFPSEIKIGDQRKSVVYVQGGWGKINAASSTQYAIDRWHPVLLVNCGTCGGFEGSVRVNDILLVNKTVVYDIVEQMGDSEAALKHYATTMDLAWLAKPYPTPVIESVLVSADRDIRVDDIPELKKKFGAIAADWESGAIACTAKRNQTACLILRAVSDIVGIRGGEAYGDPKLYEKRTYQIMKNFMEILPSWIKAADKLLLPGALRSR